MEPILHLSLPVHDLTDARAFYVDALGCTPGRLRERWADVWFYGMQVTLHERPEQLLTAEDTGVRHFGVAVSADQLDVLFDRLRAHHVEWLSEPSTDYTRTPQEQRKAKILDPSGDVIEIKAYVDPPAALEAPHLQPT